MHLAGRAPAGRPAITAPVTQGSARGLARPGLANGVLSGRSPVCVPRGRDSSAVLKGRDSPAQQDGVLGLGPAPGGRSRKRCQRGWLHLGPLQTGILPNPLPKVRQDRPVCSPPAISRNPRARHSRASPKTPPKCLRVGQRSRRQRTGGAKRAARLAWRRRLRKLRQERPSCRIRPQISRLSSVAAPHSGEPLAALRYGAAPDGAWQERGDAGVLQTGRS